MLLLVDIYFTSFQTFFKPFHKNVEHKKIFI